MTELGFVGFVGARVTRSAGQARRLLELLKGLLQSKTVKKQEAYLLCVVAGWVLFLLKTEIFLFHVISLKELRKLLSNFTVSPAPAVQ